MITTITTKLIVHVRHKSYTTKPSRLKAIVVFGHPMKYGSQLLLPSKMSNSLTVLVIIKKIVEHSHMSYSIMGCGESDMLEIPTVSFSS